MGSYSELYLGPFYVGGDKGDVNPLVMSLFRESDKRVLAVPAHSSQAERYVEQDAFEPDELITVVHYSCSASIARDRLELMGFTLDVARRAFDVALRREIRRFQQWSQGEQGEIFQDVLAVLTSMSSAVWLNGLREVRERGLQPTYMSDEQCREYSPILRHMLCFRGREWYGYPGDDVRHMIRLAIEVCEPEDELRYDLTHLVLGGYYDTADQVTEAASYLLEEDFIISQRVVVLTEGATDKWILERSLQLLFPHLADYFSFMDFEGARVAGGAGALANIVKAFVGAGIANRFVALFDNDTAARSALRSLAAIRLPSNAVVLQYPELPLAREYPTLGPGGVVPLDVNGLAGSIELYLGSDVLHDGDGFIPVQWRGYNDGVGQYQGEILHKSLLHDRFRAKLTACETSPEQIPEFDWSGVRLILDALRSAFHPSDAELLIQAEASSDDEP